MKRGWLAALIAAAIVSVGQAAWAGPVIIDGTDSNDHGNESGGLNEEGWLYMQKALENIASQVAGSVTKAVINLGADSGNAFDAITSAFTKSSLPGSGWSLSTVNTAASIDAWLAGLSTSNTGILYIPTSDLTGGDLENDEALAINGRATEISNYVAGAGTPALGGGLFAQGQSPGSVSGTPVTPYGWLTTLIPGIVVSEFGSGGINSDLTLTPAGNTAFPLLTDADLSAGPWHNGFSGDLGGLSVLATGDDDGLTRNVIIGGGAGTTFEPQCGDPGQEPCPPTGDGVIPEPGSMALLGVGMLAMGLFRRKIA